MIQSMAAVKPLTMASLMLVTVVVIPVRILVNAVVTVFQIFWATPEMKPQIVEKILEITFHTAVKRACALFGDKRKWNALVRHAMKCDYSWNVSAEKYMELYRSVLG